MAKAAFSISKLDPRFTENRLLYLSYAEPGDRGTAGTAVARAKLIDNRLENLRVIFRQQPKVTGANHFGSRLVFARDGTLFITLGDRYDYRDKAQDLSVEFGKIVRVHPDGMVPRDNPFVGKDGAEPEIWSYGHRRISKRRPFIRRQGSCGRSSMDLDAVMS